MFAFKMNSSPLPPNGYPRALDLSGKLRNEQRKVANPELFGVASVSGPFSEPQYELACHSSP